MDAINDREDDINSTSSSIRNASDDDGDDDDGDEQSLTEEELMEEKLIETIHLKRKLPNRTRKKIDKLVKEFLDKIEWDIYRHLCNSRDKTNNNNNEEEEEEEEEEWEDDDDDEEESDNDEEYYGLDSDRDTKAEVETAIRLFPHVLRKKSEDTWDSHNNDDEDDQDDGEDWWKRGYSPIHHLTHIKSVAFLPLVVGLVMEFTECDPTFQCHDCWRYCLLEQNECRGCPYNVFQLLVLNGGDCGGRYANHNRGGRYANHNRGGRYANHSRDVNNFVDNKYLDVLKELKQMDIFFKEDICDYELLHHLINGMRNGDEKYVVGKRFEFLVNWDPYELLHRNKTGHLPLHYAAHNMHADQHLDIFRKVFETGMQYFPKKRGILLLFTECTNGIGGKTPLDETLSRRMYQELSRIEPEKASNIRREKKLEILSTVVEAILSRNAAVPIDTEQALLLAATDKLIDFDCAYFLLRREPDAVVKLLSAPSSSEIRLEASMPNSSSPLPKSTRSLGQTVASSTYGDDRLKVIGRTLLDPYGDEGTFTGVVLRNTGMPHGQGKMVYEEDLRVFDGEWRHGRWHGFGRASFSNGDSYEGEYKLDRQHGTGLYRWNDGRVYDGQFSEDKRHGKGKFTWPDGAVYEGFFVNGQRQGHYGNYTFADGGQYDGSWKGGQYDGFGTCTWEDGRRYRGAWRNGMAHGHGAETYPNGSIRHEGQWIDDEPVRVEHN